MVVFDTADVSSFDSLFCLAEPVGVQAVGQDAADRPSTSKAPIRDVSGNTLPPPLITHAVVAWCRKSRGGRLTRFPRLAANLTPTAWISRIILVGLTLQRRLRTIQQVLLTPSELQIHFNFFLRQK